MKKSTIILTVLCLVMILSTVFVSAGNWEQFASSATNNAISSAVTPQNQTEAKLLYKAQVKDPMSWDGISNIITADGYVYVATGSTLKKIDENGSITEAQFSAPVSSSPFIAYHDGKIFAFVNDGTKGYFEAIDTSLMQVTIKSRDFDAMENFSPLTVYNNRIYAALSGYDYSSWTVTPGYIVGINAALDDDDMIMIDTGLSYYWNGVAISGDKIISGNIQGLIQIFDLFTGQQLDEMDTDDSIKTSAALFGDDIYMGTGNGYLLSISLGSDGKLNSESFKKAELGSQVTTTPVIYNGKVYAGTGDFTGGNGFFVIDSDTLEIIYSYKQSGIDSWSGEKIQSAGIQSSPLLTSAYGSIVYVYFSTNAKPGDLIAIKDMPGQKEANARVIFDPAAGDQNSTVSSIATDDSGTLYYTNDSGILFAVSKTEPNPATADRFGIFYMIILLVMGVFGTLSLSLYRSSKQIKAG